MLTPDLAKDDSEIRHVRNEKGTGQSLITFAKTCDLLESGIKMGQWLTGALIPSTCNDSKETIPSRSYGDG